MERAGRVRRHFQVWRCSLYCKAPNAKFMMSTSLSKRSKRLVIFNMSVLKSAPGLLVARIVALHDNDAWVEGTTRASMNADGAVVPTLCFEKKTPCVLNMAFLRISL